MGEELKRWRCPYCDGLNDWQNETCEICGDGKRPDLQAPSNEAEEPGASMPPERKPEAPKPESARVAPQPADVAPPPSKPKRKGGVVIAIVLVALAAFGGRLLANSFVSSMEKNRPTAKPLTVVNTPQPTLPEQMESVEAPAAATQAPTTAPKPAQVEAGATIGSVTDNGNGTATVTLKVNAPADKYWIFWNCVGPDPDAPSIIKYNIEYPVSLPRAQVELRPPEDTVTLTVIPGNYTRFFVQAVHNDRGLTSGDIWQSEPYFFKENPDKPPFTVSAVNYLKWNSDKDWNDSWDMRNSKEVDIDAVHRLASVYQPTTAQAMNDLLRQWADRESEAFLADEILLQQSDDIMAGIDWNQKYGNLGSPKPFAALMTGPGFCTMCLDERLTYVNNAAYIFLNEFHTQYRLLEKFGGYPAGDYTIDYFYCGAKVYTLRFTLG